VTDPAAEARIRNLRRRVTQDPTSPLFMGLAEEYRAAGRLSDAIRTLEHGIQGHPHYLSAKVALARAYLEAGRTGDAAALFSRVLGSDPGNLISARSLAEIALARGDQLEAVKKYKLYRALSADRGMDEVIARLEEELDAAASPSPRGRVLARLYLDQGHPAEALAVLEEISREEPADAEIERLRQEAAALVAGSGPSPAPVPADAGAPRRAARIRALQDWLGVIRRPA
jgi:tetratricopeptide (TPR) repeat protein